MVFGDVVAMVMAVMMVFGWIGKGGRLVVVA